MSNKILFILKGTGPDYSDGCYGGKVRPAGLANSARFVSDMLNANGLESKVVNVVDNNSIDAEVSQYKPDIVIIEALWVVPEKFDVLKKLHPNVKWIVRLHSELPFLASEGIAIDWIYGYQARGVYIGVNSLRMVDDLLDIWVTALYLPNYYPVGDSLPSQLDFEIGEYLFVGCFGAIRPLKNHLTQAVAAIKYADAIGKKLAFNINTAGADPNVLKNLRALFGSTPGHVLREYGWLKHKDFVNAMGTMDVLMQCSLSETFNITTADAVAHGVPVVVSSEISWVSRWSKTNPNSVDSIALKLEQVLWLNKHGRLLERRNFNLLKKFDMKSQKQWIKEMEGF